VQAYRDRCGRDEAVDSADKDTGQSSKRAQYDSGFTKISMYPKLWGKRHHADCWAA
jgi:hypothetical protein